MGWDTLQILGKFPFLLLFSVCYARFYDGSEDLDFRGALGEFVPFGSAGSLVEGPPLPQFQPIVYGDRPASRRDETGSQLDALLDGEVSIRAENGNLWKPVNRGYNRENIEALKSGVDGSSLFTFEKADKDHVYIRSKQNGKYISRINRGINYIEAGKTKPDVYCKFKVIFLGKFVAFQADNGRYLSRVHRGGRNNIEPLKTTIDPYCKFTVEKQGSQLDALLDGEVSIRAENGNLWKPVNRGYNRENIEALKSEVDGSSLFTFEKADKDHVYIRSKQNGKYLSRINRGINYIEAGKTKPDVYCKFKVIFLGKFVAFQADNGRYLSRVHRGGRDNIEPLKTTIDPYCKFTVEKQGSQLDALLDGEVSIRAENGNLWKPVNRGYNRENIEALKSEVDGSSLFTFEKADKDHVYIRSKQNGKYISRINRGINYIEAGKTKPDVYCKFKVIFLGKFVAFQADNGRYLSRVHRGGRNNIEPLKTTIDPYCKFTVEKQGSQLDALLDGEVSIRAENGNLWKPVNRGYNRENIEALKSEVDGSSLFTFEKADKDHVYIRSKQNGKYLSRINRGINYIEAGKTKPDVYCKFKVIFLGKFVAFQADNGRYLSRVHRGGRNNIEPLKTTIDPYCKFTVEKQEPDGEKEISGPEGEKETSGPDGEKETSGPDGEKETSGPDGEKEISGPGGEKETSGPDEEKETTTEPLQPVKPIKPKIVEPNGKQVAAGHLPYNVDEIAKSGTMEYKTSVECIVLAKNDDDGGRVLVVDEQRCPLKPSLQYFLQHFFEHRGDVDALTKDFVQPKNMIFKQMQFHQGYVNFKAEFAGKQYKHTQTMITLTQVKLNSLRIPTDNTVLYLETMEYAVEGFNKLGKCLLQHHAGRRDTLIDITTKAVTIKDFILNWNLIVEDLVQPKVNFNFNRFKGATAARASIKGVYNEAEGMQLVMALRSNNGHVFTQYGATLRFLVVKRPNKPTKAAMLVEYEPSVKIRDQLKLFTNYHFSSPQFVRDQPQKWVLSSSMIDVRLIQNQKYLSVYGGSAEKFIHKGVNVYIRVNVKEALKKCDPASTASLTVGLPADGMVLVRMYLDASGVVTYLPPSLKADVFAMLKCIQPGPVELPNFLFPLTKRLNFKIIELVVAPAANKYILTVGTTKEIHIFGSLKMLAGELSIVKQGDDPLTVTAKSTLQFGSVKGEVTLSVNTDKELNFLLTIPFMDVDSFFKALGANVFGNPITGAFKGVLNVGVKEFMLSIAYKFGESENARIVASGAPVIPGLTNGHVKFVAMLYNPNADDEEKRSVMLPGNLAIAPAIARGNLTTALSKRSLAPMVQRSVDQTPITTQKRSSSRAVVFGVIYPYTRLDKIISDIGFKVHAPWLGEASIIVLVSNARKVRCSDPETGKTTICRRNKPIRDMKPEGAKDSSSTRGTERQKKTETGNSKEGGEEEEEESDEDKEAATEKELFEDIAEISDMIIAEGLTIRAMMRLPEDCQGDNMCKWMQNNLGQNLALQFDARITIIQVSLTAMIHKKVILSSDAYMTGFRFELKVGLTNSIGIGFNFYITSINAVITADITLSVGKLEMRGTMAGMIMQPFGIQFLAIGDLLLSIGITFAAGLPAIELGAQIWFGGFKNGKSTEHTLKLRGYVGIDPSNLNENYFYFESLGAGLTIGNIVRAFGNSGIKLPKLLDESGLHTFLFSLNLAVESKEIEEFGLSIPPGLKIAGMLNIIGYKIDFELRFNTKEMSLYIKGEFDPINWAGGLIAFVRSSEERSKGPKLLVDVAPKEAKLIAHIEGLIGFMGMEYYSKLIINDNGLEFAVKANLFSVIKLQIVVKFRSYGGGQIGSFAFRGCLGMDLGNSQLIQNIKNAIFWILDKVKKLVDKAFSYAKTAVNWVMNKMKGARSSIGNMRSGVSSYKDRLQRRAREIEQEKKSLEYSCKKKCGNICIPFFGWNSRCWKTIWGSWVGCMKWDHCKWRAPNIICIAGCEIGKGFKKMFLWLEKLGIRIMQGLTTVADALLKGVTHLTYLVDHVSRLANTLLDFANKALKAVLDLPRFLEKLIILHDMCLYGNFDLSDKSCVGMFLDVTLIGKRFSFDAPLCLNTNVFGKIGKSAAKKRVPEIDRIENDVAEIYTRKDAIDVKVQNLEREKANTQSEVNSETRKQYKRSLVPTREELMIHDAAYGPIPNHDLRNAKSVGAIERPWVDSFDKAEYMREMQRKRSLRSIHLSKEDSSNPCKLEATTLERYSNILDSYHTVVKQTEETKQNYLKQRRSHANHIDNINKQIQQGLLKYNMTMEEKADLAFWRDTLEKNFESYAQTAGEFLKERKRDNINVARRDLDAIMLKERGMDLPDYLNHLQDLRKRSKKSIIEHDTVNKVHKQLYAIVTEELPYRQVAKYIDNARSALLTAKRSSIPCAA